MRSKLLVGMLLVAAFAFWRADPTYSLTGRPWPACVGPLDTASGCNHLRGPVHTVDMQGLVPLIYSKKGLLIEWGLRKNGVFEQRHRYERRDGGLTVIDKSEWTGNGQVRHEEDIISLNRRGEVISRKTRADGGTFAINYEREVDSTGREVSVLSCSMDGKSCGRTESKYDEQGRLAVTREIELPSRRVVSHKEYEYPDKNRKRELDFSDLNTPASPRFIIDTTYDSAGRVIEETTSAPGALGGTYEDGNPRPGHVVRQYDGQGHLVEETDEPGGAAGTRRMYSYDRLGNRISERMARHYLAGVETHDDAEFSYEYDRYGNWTSITSYTVNYDGQRRQVGPVERRKLTYY